MLYYLSAAGLIAHTFFWGLGLAWLALPRAWRPWAWALAPGFGLALQSAVVWAGAHSALAGTDAYARGSELLPAALLVAAWLRRAPRRPRGGLGVAVVIGAAGWMLLSPMTQPGRGLTASSLGSCDHADYAAGARVFQEFARDDRTGFLGLPEVTHVGSSQYFFDFWLRLNHFTPSALLAHNAAVFGVEAYRLISVTAAALVLLNLPVLVFLARLAVGIRGAWLAGLAALYAFSPLNAYAVHHGALGQLYAAQGIALLTVAVFGAGGAVARGRSPWAFLPLLLAAFWLLAGGYNFILLVCLAPAGTWLVFRFYSPRDWRRLGRVLAVLAAALAICAGLFWGRFAGLAERFTLFAQYDFGWVVPLASPEGWLGLLRDTALHGFGRGVRIALSAGVVLLWLAGLVALGRVPGARARAAAALVLPVIAGWAVLAWESRLRANASYDAYKILAVFSPGLLAGLACWLAPAGRAGRAVRIAAAAVLGGMLAVNLAVDLAFRREASAPPLRVDRRLAEVGRLEQEPRIGSLNLLVEDFWSRLWANAFLLRKPQYFATHSYEGRLNTPLRGEWNLSDSALRMIPLRPEDFLSINDRFHVVRAAAPGLMQANLADGWYAEERLGPSRWRWSGGQGRLLVINPTGRAARVDLRLRVRALRPRDLEVRLEQHSAGVRPLDGSVEEVVFENLRLGPGRTVVTLAAEGPAGVGDAGDARGLAFALYELELHTRSIE